MIALKKVPTFINIANALAVALFPIPVIMLFYQFKGVSIGDFFLIQGLFSILCFFIEVPTGYLADVFSRKNILALGYLFFLLGHSLFYFGSGFWGLLSGELLFGVSFSLLSGTNQAYLYDALKATNRENKMYKFVGKLEVYRSVAMFISTITGGFLYQYCGQNSVVLLSMLLVFFSLCITLCSPDIPTQKRKAIQNKGRLKDIMDISVAAIKHPEIKWIILYPSFFSTITLILMWGLQPTMINIKLPIYMFSIVLGLNMFGRIVWSGYSARILDKIRFRGMAVSLLILVLISMLCAIWVNLISFSYFSYVLLFIIVVTMASFASIKVAVAALINCRIESDERATVISVERMVYKCISGLAMIALKPLFDNIGITNTFIVCSLLFIPLTYLTVKVYKLDLTINK